MVTKEDILTTAALLNISIEDSELDALHRSFSQLVEYYAVMEMALQQEEPADQAEEQDYRVEYRNDNVEPHSNAAELIARSEEHEDDFVLIPHIF